MTALPLTPTFTDGALLAINAVTDAALVIDCADCGADKLGVVAMSHDFHSHMLRWDGLHRARFSDLRANDLVFGTEDKLRSAVRDQVAERDPKVVFLLQSSMVQLIGTDAHALAEDLEAELEVPMVVVPPRTFEGDYLEGYAAVESLLAQRVTAQSSGGAAGDGQTLALVGYFYDRSEEDHRGNLRELTRLTSALGLELVPSWLSGCSFDDLKKVGRAGTIVALPYGHGAADILSAELGLSQVRTALPLGLAGTCDWLRAVGKALGKESQAEATIQGELSDLAPRIQWAVRYTLMGKKAAVFGDRWLAPALKSALEELGLEVPFVALQARRGAELPEALRNTSELLVDPKFPEVQDALEDLHASNKLDIVIGSGTGRETIRDLAVPYVEIGFPSYVRHAFFDAPWMGFRGAAWLVDQLYNSIREWEYRKGQ